MEQETADKTKKRNVSPVSTNYVAVRLKMRNPDLFELTTNTPITPAVENVYIRFVFTTLFLVSTRTRWTERRQTRLLNGRK